MKKYIPFFVLAFVCLAQPSFAQNYNNTLRSTINYPGQNLANVAGYWQNGEEYALVGASLGLSIVDITNPDMPVEIVQIPGPNNRWKEIKTYKNFAYVTSEGGLGVQIIDLSDLPSANLNYHYYTGTGALAGALNKIHALHIDTTAGFLYCWGGTQSGATIHDLNADPYNPTYVSQYQAGGYIHDGYVDNDTMFACHIYAGTVAMVDMHDKANPVFLGSVETPNKFTHNTWITLDRKHILTTDERSGSYLASYDISDPTDIVELDRMQMTPGSGSIVHNTHITGHYAVNSWYTDGYNVVDAYRPQNLVQVGAYDTWPSAGGNGFNGCWGVYPFFPSGTIIASNINPADLLILTPTYKEACYVEGTVRDACSGLTLSGVDISINSNDPLTATTTDNKGIFRTGQPTSGNFTVTVSKAGYVDQTFDVDLQPHQIIDLQIDLHLPAAYTQLPAIDLCAGESVTICGNTFNTAGSFSSTCPDVTGCDSIVQFTINMPTNSAVINGNATISCAEPSTMLFTSAMPGTITWYENGVNTPFSQAQTILVNQTGTYILSVSETLGNMICTTFDTIIVSGNTVPPSIALQVDLLTCANPSTIIHTTSSSNQATYEWIGQNGFVSQMQSPSVSMAGDYVVVVTDEFGCSASQTIEVQSNQSLPSTTLNSLALDCNQSSGDLSAQGLVLYNYLWNTNETSQTISVGAGGTYSVTLTDITNGCTAEYSTLVTADFMHPNLNLQANGLLTCTNQFVQLTASSTNPVTFAWNTGETNPMIMVNQAGQYGVTVTGANGCTSFETSSIVQDIEVPEVDATVSGELNCVQHSVQLSASSNLSNLSFAWAGPTGTLSGASQSVEMPGSYICQVTNPANGCINSTMIDVTQNIQIPGIIALVSGPITCTNPLVVLTAQSNTPVATFTWAGPNGGSYVGAMPTVQESGIYTLEVTDPANGCTNSSTVTVEIDTELPTITITQDGPLTCDKSTVLLVADAPTAVDFQWTMPNGTQTSGQSLDASQAGQYTLIATGSNGCTNSQTVEVLANIDIPALQISGGATLTCANPTTTLNATSSTTGSTFTWTSPMSTVMGASIVAEIAGNYEVVITDANGCTNSMLVDIEEDKAAPTIETLGGTLSCLNQSLDVMVTANVPCQFQWQNLLGQTFTGATVTVMEESSYTVTATSSNGCTSSSIAVVEYDATIGLDPISASGTINCCSPNVDLKELINNNDLVFPMGGDTIVDVPGVYVLTLTESTSGCTVEATFEIDGNLDVPIVTATGGILTCAMPNATLTSQITGVNNPTIAWTGPNNFSTNFPNPSTDEPGIYIIEVTNPVNCCASLVEVEVLDSCLISTIGLVLEKSLLKVYPNATKGLVTLESMDIHNLIDGVKVFNQEGRLVLEQNVAKSATVSFDLFGKAAGVYPVQVFSEGRYWMAKVLLVE